MGEINSEDKGERENVPAFAQSRKSACEMPISTTVRRRCEAAGVLKWNFNSIVPFESQVKQRRSNSAHQNKISGVFGRYLA